MINAKTKSLCLIGSPVAHSNSPKLHNEFYKENNINAVYTAFDVKPQNLKDSVYALKALRFVGFNVTSPHKREIVKYMDELDISAKNLGSVNTVCISDNKMIGFNTDVYGFKMLLVKNSLDIKDKNIAIFGTGGAAISVIYALMDMNIWSVDIYSRNPKEINKQMKEVLILTKLKFNIIDYKEFEYNKTRYDYIINATPLGMDDNLDFTPVIPSGLNSKVTLIDLIYSPNESKFLRIGRENGYKTINGELMFLYQALKSFEIWFGVKQKTDL